VALRNYNDTAAPVALTGSGVNGSVQDLPVASTAGYPAPPFTLGIERGTANEELCLCDSMTSTNFHVTRGFDGTTGKSHATGAIIEHCVGAVDYRDANAHIYDTSRDDHTQYQLRSALTTKGDLYVRGASGVLRLPVGADGTTLAADSTQTQGLKWTTLNVIPPGALWAYGGATAPAGWLLCDGSTVARTTYAALFAIVGTQFNTGGEAGTDFRVPDLRGRAAIGKGQGTGLVNRTLGARGGEESHQLITSEIPSHGHAIPVAGAPGGGFGFSLLSSVTVNNTAAFTTAVGGGGSHNNMQPFLTVTYIIKT
jgi:microcystin-dependent protein